MSSRASRLPRRSRSRLPGLAVAILMILGYVVPLALVVGELPTDSSRALDALRDGLSATVRTVGLSAFVAVVSLPIAIAIAQPLSRLSVRLRLLAGLLLAAPLVLNLLVIIMAWMAVLEPDGLLPLLWHRVGVLGPPPALLYTPAASVVAMTYVVTPVMALLLLQTFSQIDPRTREAAQLLGASRLRQFIDLDLRYSAPSIATALIVGYLICLNLYLIPEFLTGPQLTTLGMLIQLDVLNVFDLAHASVLSVELLATALLPLFALAVVESKWGRR